MKTLDEIRKEISAIDEKMAQLFEKRMEAAAEVAAYKKEHALPIFDGGRENELIKRNSQIISDTVIREYYVDFLKNNMALSRAYQARLNEGLRVAYSGVEGAFAYIAAKRMYPEATLVPYSDFESAYRAAEG
ncbi:MAG: chorismate mutase, partial [Clostridia bacterium]|nr:chorismate mutase [Clostridia bacterium]